VNLVHRFRQPALLREALTHRSFSHEHKGEPDNQRFEFLGDSVVQLVVTEMLLVRRPTWPPGKLSRARTRLVDTAALAELCAQLDLPASMRLGRGAGKAGDVERDKPRADLFEAVIGAVFLDGGLDAARAELVPLFDPRIAALVDEADPVTRLQEWCQAQSPAVTWRYEERGSSGPDHARQFDMAVILIRASTTMHTGLGQGSSKDDARRAAAADALAKLGR
jgi:ribonuclease-3